MADLRPQYNEEVVGANHPTKTDVTSRAWDVEHDIDGTHKLPIPAGTEMLFIQNAAPTGWTRNAARQDNAMLCYASAGNPASGGNVNPQSTHTHTGPSHTHTGPSHTHAGPSHNHRWFYKLAADASDRTWDINGSIFNMTVATIKASPFVTMRSAPAVTGPDNDYYTEKAGTGVTGAEGTGATGAEGTGATGANTTPYYQEVISATKD